MRRPKAASAAAWALLSFSGTANAFEAALNACPIPCDGATRNWTVYTSMDRLNACDQPMLLDFAFHFALDDPRTVPKLLTCTPGDVNANSKRSGSLIHPHGPHGASHMRFHNKRSPSTCISGREGKVSLSLNMDSIPGTAASGDLDSILDHVQSYFADGSNCDTTNLFGYLNGAAVGIYSGVAIDNAQSTSSLIQRLRDQIPKGDIPKSVTMQHCHGAHNADYIFGFAVDTTGNLAAVQKSVSAWSSAQCVGSAGANTEVIGDATVLESPLSTMPINSSTVQARSALTRRGDCETVRVHSRDLCGDLASKCGIPMSEFMKYNSGDDFCRNLAVGQRVCCTSGTLPDIRPKPNDDGSCASYKVQADDI